MSDPWIQVAQLLCLFVVLLLLSAAALGLADRTHSLFSGKRKRK